MSVKYVFIILWLLSCFGSNRDLWASSPLQKIKKNCGCETDTLMDQFTTTCDTIFLMDQSKLYYQFNCDSIWLTLERFEGQKIIIDSWNDDFKELYGYHYRLGYHLSKEYDRYLLFRRGCPANGPCNFVLIDKITGQQVRELGELIYDHEHETFYDFVIYFKERNVVVVDFIDHPKIIEVPVNEKHFNSMVPEYQFDKIHYDGKILQLTYEYGKGRTSTISINTSIR
ncbi:MAG: hypothetical protein WC756_19470 [Taibaiella sp.]|jgi:hypothetical protein